MARRTPAWVPVGAMTGLSVLVVGALAAFDPDPQQLEAPGGHAGGVVEPARPVPAVPEPPVGTTEVAAGVAGPGHRWRVAVDGAGPEGPCLNLEVTEANSGHGIGVCGPWDGVLDVETMGAESGDLTVVGGIAAPEVERLVLEVDGEERADVALVPALGERAFGLPLVPGDGPAELVAYGAEGEELERRPLGG